MNTREMTWNDEIHLKSINAIYICKHRKDNAHIVNKDLWHGSRIHSPVFHSIET